LSVGKESGVKRTPLQHDRTTVRSTEATKYHLTMSGRRMKRIGTMRSEESYKKSKKRCCNASTNHARREVGAFDVLSFMTPLGS